MTPRRARLAGTLGVPPRAIIFDLDGTILKTGGIQTFFEIAAHFNLPLDGREDIARRHWGISGREIVQLCWPEMDPVAFYEAWAFGERGKQLPLFEGVREALAHLHEQGMMQAILTNRDPASGHHQLELHGIAHFFHCIAGAGHSNFLKPHPKSMDSILDIFWDYGIYARQEILFVGDTIIDLRCAQNAGVPFVAVLSGGVESETFQAAGLEKERILPSVADLPQYLGLK